MKRLISLLLVLSLTMLGGITTTLAQEEVPPPMNLMVRVSKLTLRTEPNRNAEPVKDNNNKSIQLRMGDVVYESTNRAFHRPEYGEYCYIRTLDGIEGFVIMRYLTYGYKIFLNGDHTQNIYTSEWACINGDLGVGSGVGDRINEILIVVDETVECLHVLTIENPVEGYISRYADYEYLWE